MALLRDIYNLVNYVDEVEGTDRILKYKGDDKQAWNLYAAATGMSKKRATYVGRTAVQKEYLTWSPVKESSGGPLYYRVAPNGVELIDRTMLGLIPKGLWSEWSRKNREFNNLVTAFVGGLIASGLIIVFWHVIKKALHLN